MKLFAYSIAHDLKGPTVSIHGLAKRIQDHYRHALDEKGKAQCGHVLKAAEDIAELVENLNTYVSTKETPLSICFLFMEALGMEGVQARIGSLGWLSEQLEQKDSIIIMASPTP
jgi:light-regulated signal transduction histidine kinase (bacteriophytochrome)